MHNMYLKTRVYKFKLTMLIFTLALLVTPYLVAAQSPSVQMKITLSSKLVDAEVLNLAQLGVSASSGSTSDPLFWLEIVNRTQEEVRGLKLVIEVSSTRSGQLLFMEGAEPGFSLAANQRVFASSNQMKDGLPGVKEPIEFEGTFNDKLTSSGNDLYNATGGNLPNDLYTITLSLKQGFTTLATTSEYLGVKPIQSAVDFFLLQPGSSVGSGAAIVTTNPNFRWDGPRNGKYRLIVVKKNPKVDDSAESLIQSAFSTEPTIVNGSARSATLLDFEMVDVIISSNDFTLPPQGVQRLEEGFQYFWQIFYIATTKNGEEYRPSTIWEFNISKPGQNAASNEVLNQIYQQLALIVGQDLISELKENGFKLVSVEYDNQTVNGPMLMQVIEQIKQKFESGQFKF